MGFSVDFYKLKKADNSTKRPSGAPSSFSCSIKRGSGLINPHIELDIGLAEAPLWNYCYISNFKRYYRITEWYNDGPLWIGSCVVDELATYKDDIASTPLYALRASSEYDGRIVDGYYPAKTGCTQSKQAISTPWVGAGNILGTYVIGVVGKNPEYGSLNYYAMNKTAFETLLASLMDDTLFNDMTVDGISKDMIKNIADPLQYIKSCVFIPITLNNITGAPVRTIKLWNWDISLTPALAAALQMTGGSPYKQLTNITVSIPKHPQASTRGSFLNQAPFSIYTLSFPPFGTIDIDTSVVNNITELTLKISIDIPTGLGILSVYAGNILLNRIEAQIGVEVALTQVTRDYLSGVSAILGGITSVAGTIASLAFPPAGLAGGALAASRGMAVMQGAGGAGNAIGNAITALTPRSQTIGSGGSYGQLYQEAGLYAQFFDIVDDDLAKNGRPLCKIVYPSSGYYKIQDGDVPIEGTALEAAGLKAYLESGFYME